jgi:exonuclease VII small subunit
MPTLDLTTQSDIQLELLLAKEQNMLNSFANVLNKLEAICQDQMDLTLDQVLEFYEYSIDRMKALQEEISHRQKKISYPL